jgi:hypothetical protein
MKTALKTPGKSSLATLPALVKKELQAPARPLDPVTRDRMETRFGHDFGRVRIHTGQEATESAQSLHAEAYTLGNDIVLGASQNSLADQAGQKLLAHELTHVVQQGGATAEPNFDTLTLGAPSSEAEREAQKAASVVSMGSLASPLKAGSGNRVVQRQSKPSPASPAEKKAFVRTAIEFLKTEAEFFRLSTNIDDARLDQVLKKSRTTYSASRELIRTDLGNDPTLAGELLDAYKAAVKALVAAAAKVLKRTTHDLYDSHRSNIHEAAWPHGLAEPKAGELTERLSAKERAGIQVYTASVTLSNLDDLFSTKVAKTTIGLPPGVTVQFASNVPKALHHGLQNVAGALTTHMTPPMKVNNVITIALDLEPYGGDYGAYRFTYVHHAPAKRKKKGAEEILIERLGPIGLEALPPSQVRANQAIFDRHGFIRGSGWSNAEFESLLGAIGQVPDAMLTPVNGITFQRGSVSATDAEAAGDYNPTTHVITLYNLAFKPSDTRVGMPGAGLTGRPVRALVHEIGHALDLLPLRRVATDLDTAKTTLRTAFARFEDPPGSGNFKFPSTEQGKFNRLSAAISQAEKAQDRARSLSGYKWQKNAAGDFETVEGGKAAAKNEFRQAALKDGSTRITKYSEKEWGEFFADSFSLYITAPETLRQLRPNLYDYFVKNFPDPGRPARTPPRKKS